MVPTPKRHSTVDNPFEDSPSLLSQNIVTPGIFRRRVKVGLTPPCIYSRFQFQHTFQRRTTTTTVSNRNTTTSSSFWSIEQMAAILPVEFAEGDVAEQESRMGETSSKLAPTTHTHKSFIVDFRHTERAHAAIESFWSENAIYAPSPDSRVEVQSSSATSTGLSKVARVALFIYFSGTRY